MRSSARAIPIWRRYGLPGGAKSSPANGRPKRPATRSRSRFARRSTPMRCPKHGSRRCWTRACRRSRRRTISTSWLFAPSPTRARARGLRLASRIAAGGQDLDPAEAHAPAGMALALTRLLKELPFKAGSAPTLIPTDVAARHGVSVADFDARRVSPGVIAACAELRGLARDELAEAERRLKSSSPAILPAFIPLAPCGSTSTGSTAMRTARSMTRARSRRCAGNGRSGDGRERGRARCPRLAERWHGADDRSRARCFERRLTGTSPRLRPRSGSGRPPKRSGHVRARRRGPREAERR